ncbi:MAG: anthranilate synthase component I family protein [candidate division Zixibacteria bacterium]|nr:anthranilate synthase component I family protein [candidate division Zixibacteria bacterium]
MEHSFVSEMNITATTIATESTLQELFAPLSDQPGAVWLDSSLTIGDRGRYSFIGRNPSLDAILEGDRLIVRERGGQVLTYTGHGWLDVLDQLWADGRRFSVGYLSYEATLPFIGLKPAGKHPVVPDARFLFYDSVLRYDHETLDLSATSPDHDDYADLIAGDYTSPSITGSVTSQVSSTISRRTYLDKVSMVKNHLYEGDIYQANFTTRMDINSAEHPFDAYMRLRQLSPAPYSAYLNFGDYQILSSSPERMLLRKGNRITTGPIKGTIARGRTLAEQKRNQLQLLNSEKDKSELLMIVDLERNDLGRIAHTGSVAVDALFRPEVYSSVIHLVADISATVNPRTTTGRVLAALLPGGSITGAPKKRAVEILSELEPVPRSVYTGVIGFVHDGCADFSIAIRTMIHYGSLYQVHAGGGIVADSDPEMEYAEMLLKASNMLESLKQNMDSIAWQRS